MDFIRFEQTLREAWGEEAALARHEIYFISQRKRGWRQVAHAAAALLRDIWLCARLPRRTESLSATVCAVSLAGASGWDTLAPLLPALQATGQTVSVLIHPRLRGLVPSLLPAAPDWLGWRKAFRALFQQGCAAIPGVSPWTLRCCLARRQLWLGAWRHTLANSGSNTRVVLLHNDFDLFSAAAAESTRNMPTIHSLCVQHGLPTDEFFPTRADIHLVWGDSSRKTYLSHNTLPNSIVIGTHRAKPSLNFQQCPPAPQRILLVSQTHTPIFGRSLENDFLRIACVLDRELGEDAFHILLHPEESRLGHPYATTNLLSRCKKPPHEAFIAKNTSQTQPALILGFCSTALLEAAQAGHFVVGINWEVPISKATLNVATPQYQVSNGAEVLQLFERLVKNAEFRSEWLQQQLRWVDTTFSPLPVEWLDRCLQNQDQQR